MVNEPDSNSSRSIAKLAICAVFTHAVFTLLLIGAVYDEEPKPTSLMLLLGLVCFATPYYLILPPFLAVRHKACIRKQLLVGAALLAISVSPILWPGWLICILTR